jgi:hypothetical protein
MSLLTPNYLYDLSLESSACQPCQPYQPCQPEPLRPKEYHFSVLSATNILHYSRPGIPEPLPAYPGV